MLEALSLDIIAPAFVAGLLVLATHVPLGSMVLDRGIVFIDIAVAQVAALGVVLGASLVGELGGLATQISALSAALLCSLFLIWSEKRFPDIQEAIIGVSFVVAAAVQIIVLSANPGGAEHLKDLLVGQILLVTPGDLIPVAIIYVAVLAVWAWRDLTQERLLFYAVFAVVITLSVQIVGVLLVFASLIVPSLAARVVPVRWRLVAAFNVGVTGYVIGLVCSALFDVPTGATIVCTVVSVAVATALVGGMLGQAGRTESLEDVLAEELIAPVASAADRTEADIVPLHPREAGLAEPLRGRHSRPVDRKDPEAGTQRGAGD